MSLPQYFQSLLKVCAGFKMGKRVLLVFRKILVIDTNLIDIIMFFEKINLRFYFPRAHYIISIEKAYQIPFRMFCTLIPGMGTSPAIAILNKNTLRKIGKDYFPRIIGRSVIDHNYFDIRIFLRIDT